MKKSKHIVIFLTILFISTIIIGFIYGINNYYDLTDYVGTLNKNNNLFLIHIGVLFLFLFSTISLLGIILESIYLGFEGVSIGYLIALFYSNFKAKGILYSLITIFINKVFFLVILFYLFYIGYRYVNKCMRNIIGLNKDYIISIIKPLIMKYCVIFLFLLIYDTFIWFLGNKILNYFTFML